MDQVSLVAEATAIALAFGTAISVAQERFFGRRLDGRAALAVNVAASLAIGAVAVARMGGFTAAIQPGDPIGAAIEIVKASGLVLFAAQAAFHVIVRPVAKARL